MQDIRYNYLLSEWVLFAPDRTKRPSHFKKPSCNVDINMDKCPFCLHNKFMCDDDIYLSENKRVRILPNKYPAISNEYSQIYGIHDVVIDTPLHNEKLYDFSDDHMYELIYSIQYRLKMLNEDRKIKYVQVFKNDGINAGASIYHSHFQIIALPFIPPKVLNIINSLETYKRKNGTCFLCDEITKSNIIYENNSFVCFMPYASLYTNEIDIVCKNHVDSLLSCDNKMLMDFALILKKSLKAYTCIYDDFNYNICFFNSPTNLSDEFHFFVQIIPRLYNLAGFEFSTGCFINSILPEIAEKEFENIIKNL